MQTEFSPPLTRFDVVMGFLKIHLWLSVVALATSVITMLSYVLSSVSQPLFLLRIIGMAAVPVLLLVLFSPLLASNALGHTARDPVVSPTDLRSLIGRCAGLLLFVQSLAPVVFLSGMLVYSLATRTAGSPLSNLFGGPFTGRYMWLEVGQIVAPILSLLIGFFLAFGPSLRDNFQGR